MKKLILTVLIAAAAAAVSCTELFSPVEDGTGDSVRVDIRTSPVRTRSSLGDVREDAVNDFNVYFYRGGRLFTEIYCEGGSVSVTLYSNESYRIYALANVGRVEAPALEEDLGSLGVDVSDFGAMSQSGLPMYYASERGTDVTLSTKVIEIPFTRLVARYVLHRDDSLAKCSFEATAIKVCQGAGDVYPFEKYSTPTFLADADEASAADIAAFNAGEDIVLYVLENRQGMLLPGNTDPWAKTADAIGEEAASKCTYISISGRWETQAAAADLNLNVFLGQDNCSDFSVVRNTEARIELCLSDESTVHFGWKVTMENCQDERRLQFGVPQMTLSQNSGWTSVFCFEAYPHDLAYNVSVSDSLLSWRIEDDGLYIFTDYMGEDRPEVELCVSTWDSLHVAKLNVVIDYTLGKIDGVEESLPEYYAQYGRIDFPYCNALSPLYVCIGDSCWVYDGTPGPVRTCSDPSSGTEFWFVPSDGALYARREAVTGQGTRVILKKNSAHQYVDLAPARYPNLTGGRFDVTEAGNAMTDDLLSTPCDAIWNVSLTDGKGRRLNPETYETPYALLSVKGLDDSCSEFVSLFCEDATISLTGDDLAFGYIASGESLAMQLMFSESAIRHFAFYGNVVLDEEEDTRESEMTLSVTLPDSHVLSADATICVHKVFPHPRYLGEVVNYEAAPGNMHSTVSTIPFSGHEGYDAPPEQEIDWTVRHCILDEESLATASIENDIYGRNAGVDGHYLTFYGLRDGGYPSCGPMVLHGSVTNPHTGGVFEADYTVDVLLSIGAQVDYFRNTAGDKWTISYSYIPWNSYMSREYLPLWREFLPDDITVVNRLGQACVGFDSSQLYDIPSFETGRKASSISALVSDIYDYQPLFPFEFSLEKRGTASPLTAVSVDIDRGISSPLYSKYRTGEKGYYRLVRQSDIRTFNEEEHQGFENIIFEVGYSSMELIDFSSPDL
ncbi:MAG: DUF4906 domain-containing protein [Bacteroidales bacterium]|nr:DUF4906 domain-containing protein [Candidatus Cryptobacteroides aphodequi]